MAKQLIVQYHGDRGRGNFFLELFAGTGRLSGAIRNKGDAVLEPVEIMNDAAFDLRRREAQRLLRWIKSGTSGFVHVSTPCTIWSRGEEYHQESLS